MCTLKERRIETRQRLRTALYSARIRLENPYASWLDEADLSAIYRSALCLVRVHGFNDALMLVEKWLYDSLHLCNQCGERICREGKDVCGVCHYATKDRLW